MNGHTSGKHWSFKSLIFPKSPALQWHIYIQFAVFHDDKAPCCVNAFLCATWAMISPLQEKLYYSLIFDQGLARLESLLSQAWCCCLRRATDSLKPQHSELSLEEPRGLGCNPPQYKAMIMVKSPGKVLQSLCDQPLQCKAQWNWHQPTRYRASQMEKHVSHLESWQDGTEQNFPFH